MRNDYAITPHPVAVTWLSYDQYITCRGAYTSAQNDAVDTVVVGTDRLRHGQADVGLSPTAMKHAIDR